MKISLFYIARKERWSDKNDRQISREEWESYVENDDSLEQTFDTGDGNFYIWKGPSKLNRPLMDWRSGILCSLCPDKALLEKMISIATDLRANVFNNDGIKFKSIENIPFNFDSELDQRLAKRDNAIQELSVHVPRCLKDFAIVDSGASDSIRGGHGEDLNICYQVKCNNCESHSFIVDGYYW